MQTWNVHKNKKQACADKKKYLYTLEGKKKTGTTNDNINWK